MSTELRLDGTKEMADILQKLGAESRGKVEDAVTIAALNVQKRAIKKIQQGPARGATRRSRVAKAVHTASAPGDPPMTDSGRLVSSIYYDQDGTTAYVGSPVFYALFLEFGTRKMAARPFLFPSLEEEGPAFRRRLQGILQ